MRHRSKKKTLDRPTSQRRLLRRNLAVSLIMSEHVQTTVAKAKWLRPFVERLVTLSRKQTLAARRHALDLLTDRAAVNTLIHELAPRYAKRPGGYTRIVKTGRRSGDGAQMAVIEFVDRPAAPTKKGKGKDKEEKSKEATGDKKEHKGKEHAEKK